MVNEVLLDYICGSVKSLNGKAWKYLKFDKCLVYLEQSEDIQNDTRMVCTQTTFSLQPRVVIKMFTMDVQK